MLLKIKEKATGWFAYAIVVLLTIPFALWGVHQYFQFGDDVTVLEVADIEVSRGEFNARMLQRKRAAEAAGAPAPNDTVLRSEVLSGMVQGIVIGKLSDEQGYDAPDSEVARELRRTPDFLDEDGVFDREIYRKILQAGRLTESAFEEQVRARIAGRQFQRVVTDSSFVLPQEQDNFERLLFQERSLRFFSLPTARYFEREAVSAQDAATYYEGRKEEFATPDRARVSYVTLDLDALLETEEPPDEDAVFEYYEDNIESFGTPEARRLAHILFDAEKHGEDEALARAQSVHAQLEDGEDFAHLAREWSDDLLSAEDGGELPPLAAGDLPDEVIEDAVFALLPGEYSEPLESRFGVQIFKLLAIESSSTQSFEEAREGIAEELRREAAHARFNAQLAQAQNLLYENPYSLAPLAQALGAEVVKTDWLTRSTTAELFDYPALRSTVFSAPLVNERLNSAPITVDEGLVYAVRVDAYEPTKQRSFDDAREEVIDKIAQQRAEERARAALQTVIRTLVAGATTPLVALLEEVVGAPVRFPQETASMSTPGSTFGAEDEAMAGLLAALGATTPEGLADGMTDDAPAGQTDDPLAAASGLDDAMAAAPGADEDAAMDSEAAAKAEDDGAVEMYVPGYVTRIDPAVPYAVVEHAFRLPAPENLGERLYAVAEELPERLYLIELSGVREGARDEDPPLLSMSYREFEALVRALMREGDMQVHLDRLEDSGDS